MGMNECGIYVDRNNLTCRNTKKTTGTSETFFFAKLKCICVVAIVQQRC